MTKKDIDIDVAISGVSNVNAGFGRIMASANKMKSGFSSVGVGARKDMLRVADVLGSTTGMALKLGEAAAKVSFVAAAGSVAGVVLALQKASSITKDIAAEIDAMGKESAYTFAGGAANVGGIKFAFEQNGIDAEKSREFMSKLNKLIEDGANGDEASIEKLANLGLAWEDILKDGNRIDMADAIKNMADAISTSQDKMAAQIALQSAFGEDLGPKLGGLFQNSGEEFEKLVNEYKRLTGIKQTDYEVFAKMNDQLNAESKAVKGLANAFGSEFAPALTRVSEARQEFFVGFQDEAAMVGAAMGEFLSELTPLFISAGDILSDIISGAAEESESSPLRTFIESLIDLVKKLGQAAIDTMAYLTSGETDVAWLVALEKLAAAAWGVLVPLGQAIQEVVNYISTGETDAPWLQSLVKFSGDAYEKLAALASFMSDTVLPAISTGAEVFSDFLQVFGIDTPGEQFGIVAAMLLFRSSLVSVIGLIGKATAGLVGMTAAASGASAAQAAGAAGLAARFIPGAALVAGAWYSLSETGEYEDYVEKIADRTNELAAEKGEEFAAAYMRAAIEYMPDDVAAGNGMINIMSRFGLGTGKTSDDYKRELDDLLATKGNGPDAAAGAAAAIAELGLGVGADGVEIGAGLSIDSASMSVAVEQYLNSIPVTVDVQKIMGVENLKIPATIDAAAQGAAADAAASAQKSGFTIVMKAADGSDEAFEVEADSETLKKLISSGNALRRSRI